MKKSILLFLFFLVSPVFAYSTEGTKFTEKQYSTNYCCKVRINSKKEDIFDYEQTIGSRYIPAIIYGYGDMKIKIPEKRFKYKKFRISYIVLLDKNCHPFWSTIYFSK